ncbi:hypothetical protein D3H65_07700 [Paraflavitalea soli]|uniref:Uncharacterized protein n=1 Tax=Paraflavitalea soli TaxID=2315862 RepID=A0A3B7MTQ0_9BACT|nr:hypothetical protein [Paraflavitalea soli]AXY73871.1 hypothetical protein D3H65_07700 [Paraflavitalea soli]
MAADMDMDHEISTVTESLRYVSGYLDCEKIIIRNIRKHLENGIDESNIENYLKALIGYLERSTETGEDANKQMNHRFVIGFIYTLLRTSSWRSWVQSIQI